MLKKISTFFIAITLIACDSRADIKTATSSETQNASVETSKSDTGILTFRKFQDTKWVSGEVGVNGEQPDTIIFARPDSLTYISTDTGKELLRYSFNRDTLIFFSNSVRADINSLDDLTCESMNKLHYQSETFKYIYFEEKCTGDKEAKHIRMDTLDVKFRRL